MIPTLWRHARRTLETLQLPRAARLERQRDAAGLPVADAGIERVLPEVMGWLARAQDASASNDGGVARDYSLVKGWATSYPETTGYIIPTMLEYARRTGDADYRERALRMTDWLVKIQLADGAFQGGKIDSLPVQATTFNTGQILLGLAAAEQATGRYREPMRRAADWLVTHQDPDGCWRRHGSPFAAAGEKQYETHVAWGLFEAERVDPGRGYGDAGMANVRWALTGQTANGWFDRCCLSDFTQPLTHTLGYTLRGVIEGYRLRPDPLLLAAAERTAEALRRALRPDGQLPGRFAADWSPTATWVCLTGTAQIALCWMLLHTITGRADWLEAARRANAYVRRTVRLEGPPAQRGGVKGSFPVQGDYGAYQYLNWAAKFLADSLMLEDDLLRAAR
jgi:hypothetical protein